MTAKNKGIVVAFLAMLPNALFCATFDVDNTQEKERLALAKKIMPSTSILKVMPTEIPDMLAVLLANEEIVYLNPMQKLIFIGEIYTSNGVSVSQKHIEKITVKTMDEKSDGVLDISPLFKVSTRITKGNSKYGLIIFTDPDCPFCEQLDAFLVSKDITVDHVFTPIDSLHPNARAKAINIVMEKNKISKEEAMLKIQEGEKIASSLGIKGTPQTIVYEMETRKPVNGIVGVDTKILNQYIKGNTP